MSHLPRLKEVGGLETDTFSDSDHLPAMPDGFDVDKFNRGRKFFQYNVFSCAFAMILSLLSGLSVNNLLQPLVFTQQSNTPVKSFRRYHSTFRHILLWHFDDVWDPSSKAHRSIARVRRMHNTVRSQMMEKHDGDASYVFVSQYDMSLVQCGFMGALVMYADSFGIWCSKADLSDYCYFWYGIGYLLGIRDENNICCGDVNETFSIRKEIESDILLPALQDPPKDFYPMAKALVDGINMDTNCSLLSVEASLALILSIMSVPSPKLSVVDYFRLQFLKMLLFLVKYVPFIRFLFNRALTADPRLRI